MCKCLSEFTEMSFCVTFSVQSFQHFSRSTAHAQVQKSSYQDTPLILFIDKTMGNPLYRTIFGYISNDAIYTSRDIPCAPIKLMLIRAQSILSS